MEITRRRAFAIFVVLLFAFAAIALRLTDVQAVSPRRYAEFAKLQDTRVTTLPALRGAILDSRGTPLALSELRPTIIADPHQISDPRSEAVTLAAILHQPVGVLDSELSQNRGYVEVAVHTSTAAGQKIASLNLPGITIQTNPERFYPDGLLARPLVGSVNASGKGVSGLEYAYNRLLTGTPGRLVQRVDPQGQPVTGGTMVNKPAVMGDDIVLTLDAPLQYQTEQALAQALVSSHAHSGMALVMNTHTGALLAVADLTVPPAGSHQPQAVPVSFGANGKVLPANSTTSVPQPAESSAANAFTHVYEPGSVEKLVTVSAALSTGAITPNENFTIPNAYVVSGVPLHDAENHGTEQLSVTGIVAQSSNIGATQIVQRLGAPALYRYLAAYGLGKPTPVVFPGQSAGLIVPESRVTPLSLATMSYGEGMAVTAAQMVSVYNTIANGGVYVAPQLVKAVIGPHGHQHLLRQPPPHRVVSATVAHQMTSILEQVVSAGTGTSAKVASYAVAGKTGTAQYDGPNGYVAGRTVASFAGFAPAQKPAVTVMVVVDDTPSYGASAAAPAFSTITRDALNDLSVPPRGSQPPPEPTASPQKVAVAPLRSPASPVHLAAAITPVATSLSPGAAPLCPGAGGVTGRAGTGATTALPPCLPTPRRAAAGPGQRSPP